MNLKWVSLTCCRKCVFYLVSPLAQSTEKNFLKAAYTINNNDEQHQFDDYNKKYQMKQKQQQQMCPRRGDSWGRRSTDLITFGCPRVTGDACIGKWERQYIYLYRCVYICTYKRERVKMRKVKNVNVNAEEASSTTKTTTTTTIFLMRGGRNNNVGCLGGEVLQRSCLQDNRRETFSSLSGFSNSHQLLVEATMCYVLCATIGWLFSFSRGVFPGIGNDKNPYAGASLARV